MVTFEKIVSIKNNEPKDSEIKEIEDNLEKHKKEFDILNEIYDKFNKKEKIDWKLIKKKYKLKENPIHKVKIAIPLDNEHKIVMSLFEYNKRINSKEKNYINNLLKQFERERTV